MTWTIRVVNWREFQHYTHRAPPWIKLHRTLLQKPGWRKLSGSAAKLLVDLWVIAAGSKEGEVSETVSELAYTTRRPVAGVYRDLGALATAGFVELSKQTLADASAAQANADPEESRGEQRERQRQRTTKSVATPPTGNT